MQRLAGLMMIVAQGVTWVPNGRAQAHLANQGIPARCYGSSPAADSYLTCVTPPGSVAFVSSQRVPNGYYFMLTDVLVTPYGGANGEGVVDIDLNDAYGSGSTQSINRFRGVDGATYGQHFTAPMWVLTPDHRLGVVTLGDTNQQFEIRVSGLLTTNVTYMPASSSFHNWRGFWHEECHFGVKLGFGRIERAACGPDPAKGRPHLRLSSQRAALVPPHPNGLGSAFQ